MRAAIYLRVSTEEQRERQSIVTQADFANRYCDLHQIIIADTYSDDGISGTIPLENRQEGNRLLEDALKSKFDTVLVYKLDRLGRNPRLILNAVDHLESMGIQVKSMTEPFETSTPSGRFLLTILSGVAGLERDTIVQRSMEGSNRLAREGVWLGGIVPYGYRVEGKDRNARLAPSNEPLPGLQLSEVEVIRLVFTMAAVEKKSCFTIASYLNEIGVPPSYTKNNRLVLRGKRKEATAGIWRPSRVRNIIVNPTYMGVHHYGLRSKKPREIIERQVLPLVSVEIWEEANATLHKNLLFSKRNARRRYLLRGLIKCGLCGLTYIGTVYPSHKNFVKTYYVCNGKHGSRGIYGLNGKKCPSKAIDGNVEEIVWGDIEVMLRNPGDILSQLGEKFKDQSGETQRIRKEVELLQRKLQTKKYERDAVIALYRRRRIDESDLDRQLDQIAVEEDVLRNEINTLNNLAQGIDRVNSQLTDAGSLLKQLNKRLDQPISWELQRELIEVLVEKIKVNTVEKEGKKEASIEVTYTFSSIESRRGTGSWLRSG